MSSAKKPLQRLILSALLFLVVLPGTLFAQSDPYEAVRNQAIPSQPTLSRISGLSASNMH